MLNPLTRASHQERVLAALVHIQEHLDDPLTLEDLARLAATAPHHFHRLFRALVGEAPAEHIRRLRLERAAHRLKVGSAPIVDVALEAGYGSHEAFTRAFTRTFGTSPSEFRETSGLSSRIAAPLPLHFDGGREVRQLLARENESLDGAIRRYPAIRVAFIRHVGPYEEVTPVFAQLMEWAVARGLWGPDARLMGMAHDDPSVTPPDRLRFDTCLAIASDVKGEGTIGVQEIPAGDYAVGTHYGPFETLIETYRWLGAEYLPSTCRVMARRPAVEIYLSDPQVTAPHDLRTEIRLPLEDRDAAP